MTAINFLHFILIMMICNHHTNKLHVYNLTTLESTITKLHAYVAVSITFLSVQELKSILSLRLHIKGLFFNIHKCSLAQVNYQLTSRTSLPRFRQLKYLRMHNGFNITNRICRIMYQGII